MAFERKNDFRRAIADFSRWIEIDPACAFAYALRADAFLRNADDEHALADVSRAIDINPRSAVGHEIRGRIYAFRRDPARAVDDFTAWIETEPKSASAYHLRGRVYGSTPTITIMIARSRISPGRSRSSPTTPMPIAAAASLTREGRTRPQGSPTTTGGSRQRSGRSNPAIARCSKLSRVAGRSSA
jgi:Tfp pilus assembly protein PilF